MSHQIIYPIYFSHKDGRIMAPFLQGEKQASESEFYSVLPVKFKFLVYFYEIN
jgi:hypothetical protein